MAGKVAKSKRPEAERAGEWYLREVCGCVVTRRAVRTKWQSVDFFASDVMGKRLNGRTFYAQVTAGKVEAVRSRRRKLEAVPWHPSDRVMVLQLVFTPNPAHARRKLWFFRVHNYNHGLTPEWLVDDEAASVPKTWFRAWRDVAAEDVGDSG